MNWMVIEFTNLIMEIVRTIIFKLHCCLFLYSISFVVANDVQPGNS